MTLTNAEIAALTPQERCELVARLGGVRRVPLPVAHVRKIRRLRMGLMVPGTLILIPWTIYLAAVLPVHYTAQNWRTAWVGFDVILLASMTSTVLLGWHRRQLVLLTSFATGILLLCDAWFDVMTATSQDRASAIASALLAEVPLAAILIGGALQFVRLIAEQQGLLSREAHLWQLSIPVALEDEDQPGPTPHAA